MEPVYVGLYTTPSVTKENNPNDDILLDVIVGVKTILKNDHEDFEEKIVYGRIREMNPTDSMCALVRGKCYDANILKKIANQCKKTKDEIVEEEDPKNTKEGEKEESDSFSEEDDSFYETNSSSHSESKSSSEEDDVLLTKIGKGSGGDIDEDELHVHKELILNIVDSAWLVLTLRQWFIEKKVKFAKFLTVNPMLDQMVKMEIKNFIVH